MKVKVARLGRSRAVVACAARMWGRRAMRCARCVDAVRRRGLEPRTALGTCRASKIPQQLTPEAWASGRAPELARPKTSPGCLPHWGLRKRPSVGQTSVPGLFRGRHWHFDPLANVRAVRMSIDPERSRISPQRKSNMPMSVAAPCWSLSATPPRP